jgi:hypothetical protein
MSQTYSYWSLVIAAIIVYTVLIYYFGLQVRTLLKSMQVSKSFYAGLVKRLDLILIPWALMAIPATVQCIVFLTVPFFLKHMYILVNGLMTVAQLMNSFILLSTTRTTIKKDGEDNSDPNLVGSLPASGDHTLTLASRLGSKRDLGPHTPDTVSTLHEMFDHSSRGGDHSQLATTATCTPSFPERRVESPALLPSSSSRAGSVEASPLVLSLRSIQETELVKGTNRIEKGEYEVPGVEGGRVLRLGVEEVTEIEMETELTSSRSHHNLLEPKIWNPYLISTDSREQAL